MSVDTQYDVFVSHASKDRSSAEEMVEHLENKGIKCWVAPRNVTPGLNYGAEIIRGIERSKCLILILSEDANKSTFVMNEVERAVTKGKVIFPVRIAEILPCANLELYISSNHWIEAWKGKFIEQMAHLATTISSQFDLNLSENKPQTVTRNSFDEVSKLNEESALTLEIQNILKDLGYNVATNGTVDARTVSVIKKFEKSQGLDELGVADAFLLDKLVECKEKKIKESSLESAEQNRAEKDVVEEQIIKKQAVKKQANENKFEVPEQNGKTLDANEKKIKECLSKVAEKNEVEQDGDKTKKASSNTGFFFMSVLFLLCFTQLWVTDEIVFDGSYLLIPLSAIAGLKYGLKANVMLLVFSPLAFIEIYFTDSLGIGISLMLYIVCISLSYAFSSPSKALAYLRKLATYKWKLAAFLVISSILISANIEVSDYVYINVPFSFEFLLPVLCFGVYFFASPSQLASKIMLFFLLLLLILELFLEVSEIDLNITDDIYFGYQTSLFNSFGLILIAILSTKLTKDINSPAHILKNKYTYLTFVGFVFYLFSSFANYELSDLIDISTLFAQDTIPAASTVGIEEVEVISVTGSSGTTKISNFVICLILFFIWGVSVKSWAKTSSFILVIILTLFVTAIGTYFMVIIDGWRFEEALIASAISNLFFIISCSLMTYFGQQCQAFFKLNSAVEQGRTNGTY